MNVSVGPLTATAGSMVPELVFSVGSLLVQSGPDCLSPGSGMGLGQVAGQGIVQPLTPAESMIAWVTRRWKIR